MTNGVRRNVEFIRQRDGDAAAVEYARRGVQKYRRAVLELRGRILRPALIAAYVECKRIVREEGDLGR